jgi:hypothetical protein
MTTTTPKPVKKDIYRADCQVDDAGRSGQSTADTVKINHFKYCQYQIKLNK